MVKARTAHIIDSMGPAPAGSDPTNPKIGAQLDPRIADGIRQLTRAGYLTIGDFRSFIFVPAEYVPYIEAPQQSGVCG